MKSVVLLCVSSITKIIIIIIIITITIIVIIIMIITAIIIITIIIIIIIIFLKALFFSFNHKKSLEPSINWHSNYTGIEILGNRQLE